MVKRGRVPSEMWETFRAMSVDVGLIHPFMRESAMMGLKERELLAYCVTAIDVVKDAEFTEYIKEFAIPFIQNLGRARWGRDVVTDLGFALASRPSRKRKLGERLLKYQPETESE